MTLNDLISYILCTLTVVITKFNNILRLFPTKSYFRPVDVTSGHLKFDSFCWDCEMEPGWIVLILSRITSGFSGCSKIDYNQGSTDEDSGRV